MTSTPVEQRSEPRSEPLRVRMAEEIRALMARRRISGVSLAAHINRSQSYVSRRLTGEVAFDVDDIEAIAGVFGVKAADLVAMDGGRPWPTTLANLPVTTRPRDNRPKSGPGQQTAHPSNVRRTRPKQARPDEARSLIEA